jgi:hypothetical protein
MDVGSASKQDPKRLIVLTVIAIAITTVSGAVYGRWTQRWGPPVDLELAGSQLAEIPQQLGDWRMLEERPVEENVRQILECAGSVVRVYAHQETGAVVNVAVIVGPSGPTAVHTPEICYSSRDFEISGPRMKSWFKPPGGLSHSLWATTFRSRNAGRELLRVYYGWSAGDQWTASTSPRFEFGGSKLLYKIQVAALVGPTNDDNSTDPCQDFMDAFLQAGWKKPNAPRANTNLESP